MFHKSWVFTVLLVAIATSSTILSPFSKALETLKSSNGVKSYLKSEEEHFCGFYSTGCTTSGFVSSMGNVTLYGTPSSDPVAMDLVLDTFVGDACIDDTEVLAFILHTSLVASNDVKKQYVATLNKVSVKISIMMEKGLKCDQPIEAGKIYDVESLQCTDSEGKDPFADAKAVIGQSMTMSATFASNSLTLAMEDWNLQAAYQDATGCSSLPFWLQASNTTSTPSPAPTTLAPSAEPTTLAPTAEPTTVAPSTEPTTVAPTTEAPSTAVPTTPTPTTPTPTTPTPTTPTPTTPTPTTPTPTSPVPTTPVPTEAPTTPTPTEAPTTPVPTPGDNKMMMYALIGGGALLVVILLIVCCCCCCKNKKKDNTYNRVRRAKVKTNENTPLVNKKKNTL